MLQLAMSCGGQGHLKKLLRQLQSLSQSSASVPWQQVFILNAWLK